MSNEPKKDAEDAVSASRWRRRAVRWAPAALLVASAGLVLVPTSCGSDPSSPTNDAGPDGNVLPPGCDQDPDTKTECYSAAVFVAPGGSDTTGDGSQTNPVATIGKGISKLGLTKALIFVCQNADGYQEQVSIAAPVNIYGGFSCPSFVWTAGTNATNVVSPKAGGGVTGAALTISGVASPITIKNLSFKSQDATAAGDSSIAGWISESSGGVTLKGVTFSAGAGAVGAPPPPAAAYTGEKAKAPNGIDSIDGGGAVPNPCVAPLDPSTGGAGGQPTDAGGGNFFAADGGTGEPSTLRPDPTGFDGHGGDAHPPQTCGKPPNPGAYGPGGDPGVGAATPGHLAATGWTPAVGAPGGNGHTAQGGGGGAGYNAPGGGGGAGSCGGFGGAGGNAGGSSIALLVFNTR